MRDSSPKIEQCDLQPHAADAAADDFDLGRVAEIDAQDGCLNINHGYQEHKMTLS
jgi:hypothetical protein